MVSEVERRTLSQADGRGIVTVKGCPLFPGIVDIALDAGYRRYLRVSCASWRWGRYLPTS
jgi:hypothetical protein